MTIWIESPFDSLPIEGYRKQRYWMMAEAFVRAGHSVVYWTSDFSHARKAARRAKGEGRKAEDCVIRAWGEGLSGIMIPTRPYPKNVCFQRILSHREYARTWERMAVRAVAEGHPRPDVLIVSSPPVSTGPVAVRLARRFGTRLVVDIQDAWPETFYRLMPRGFQWVARLLLTGMRRTVGATYRQADLVPGLCHLYETLVRRYGVTSPYYRAYLGIEGGRAKSEGERAKCEGRRTKGEIRLAYVGNLGKSYDLKTVLAGVELLNRRSGVRVTLDVAGFGGRVEESEAVRFHGMLDQARLGELLSRCEIGIIPMKADSFVGIPNKLAEYAAAGLKVVSSLQGETADLIARHECGATYQAGNAASFAGTVESIHRMSGSAGAASLAEELSAVRIYDAYCRRICEA